MSQVSFSLILILLFVGICQTASFAQLNEYGRWKSDLYYEPVEINYRFYSESDFTNALTKLEAIKSENNNLTNEWAGSYSAQSGEVNVIVRDLKQ